MGTVLVQHHPYFSLRIPTTHAPHETAHVDRIFAMIIMPAYATLLHRIECKEIEAPARFLILAQDESLGTPASSTIGLDGHGLDIEKEHDAVGGQMLKNSTNTG